MEVIDSLISTMIDMGEYGLALELIKAFYPEYYILSVLMVYGII